MTRDFGPLDWGPDPEQPLDKPLNGELYSRPSDISSNLDTKENLSPYHQAQAVFGVVTEPPPHSLIKQFRALASEFTDPWNAAKQEVKSLLKLARTMGGEEFKSGVGSALHRYSVLADKGIEPDYEMSDFAPWIEVYSEAMSRFKVLEWEGFIVCDDLDNPGSENDLRCAGSYDKLVEDTVTGEIMVADLKSGKSDNDFAMSPTVQISIYAHGTHYDQETGRRWPLHENVSRTRGLLIHLPYNGGGDPRCTIYPLDLEEGFRLAKMSSQVTAARRMRAYKKDALADAKQPPVQQSPTSDPS